MLRLFVAALSALILGAGVSLADEVKGTVKKVNTENGKITITVKDKDQTFTVAKDTEIFRIGKAKKGQPGAKKTVEGGIGGIKDGSTVTVTTSKKDDKETVTSIQVPAEKKKKKKKAN